MGAASCSKVMGLSTGAIYWMDIWTFFTLNCCKNYIVCLKRPKINKKRPWLDHCLKNICRNETLPTWYVPTYDNFWSEHDIFMEMAWTSVTKWLNYLLNIGPLTAIKNCSIGKNFAKVCTRFYPKLNKTSKICERLRIFCQSGEIWANLVTLAWTKIVTVWVIEKMISLKSCIHRSFVATWLTASPATESCHIKRPVANLIKPIQS